MGKASLQPVIYDIVKPGVNRADHVYGSAVTGIKVDNITGV